MSKLVTNGGPVLRFELCGCEAMLLREIAMPGMEPIDVAMTYALAPRSAEAVDWPRGHIAIVERWTAEKLGWIKDQACTGKAFETHRKMLSAQPRGERA